MREKKDPAILEAFFSLSFFSFSSAVTRPFPSPIKGEAGHPMKGDLDPHEIGSGDKKTQEHDTSTWLSSKRALSTRLLLPSETWDPLPLLSVCNPYCKTSASNTSSNELNVGRSVRTSINPYVLRAHHPSQTRKYKFTRRWSKNTDRPICLRP